MSICKEWSLKEPPGASHADNGTQAAAGDGANTKSPPQATELVRLALQTCRLGCDRTGRSFAVTLDGPNLARPLRGTRGLRAELASMYFELQAKTPSATALADALAVLDGKAQQAEREPLGLRVAQHNGAVVLDLGDPSGACVVVSSEGWQVLERSPVLFRRTELTGALPIPVRGEGLDPLRSLVRLDDAAWHLLVAYLVASLMPDIPHPILLARGEQGTGKTTGISMAAAVIDPSPAQIRAAPSDVASWVVGAAGSWVVALDNISTLSAWQADALCRAVTGDGLVRRALYTDDDLSVVSMRRVVMLTSIDPGALRGDLAERLLPVDFARIVPTARRTDAELRSAFSAGHAGVLGALLDLLAQVLVVLPSVQLAELPRMADFARVLAAVDQVTGWTTLDTYWSVTLDNATSVVEDDPLGAAIVDLARRQPPGSGTHSCWEGTSTELLAKISPDRPSRDWPATPRALSGRLRGLAPALRSVGVEVRWSRAPGTGTRLVRIGRLDGDQPSPPSQPSPDGVWPARSSW